MTLACVRCGRAVSVVGDDRAAPVREPVCAKCGQNDVVSRVARLVAPGVLRGQFVLLGVRLALMYVVLSVSYWLALLLSARQEVVLWCVEGALLAGHVVVCTKFVSNCRAVGHAGASGGRRPWWLRAWVLWTMCVGIAGMVFAVVLVVLWYVL